MLPNAALIAIAGWCALAFVESDNRGYEHIFERDRMHTLLDRWRDIVRRAITARLMLGDPTLGDDALWPLVGDEPPVDRYLARKDRRDEWRAKIVDGAAASGLPLVADPAPPLIDYLHNDPDKAQ